MRLVLVGPPGAGKGTQAEFISAHFAIPHISTGDIFRANLSAGTPLGLEAKGYMDKGDLVPDSLTTAMVKDRLQQGDVATGFLLDGYPRTTGQAAALDEILREINTPLDVVLEMQADEDEIVTRLLARGRSDDSEEVIRHRLKVYAEQTAPIISYYHNAGILRSINGLGAVAEVTQRAIAALTRELRDNYGY
ncbi:MAG: adenylate kinase [Actinobacteria bacterium]|nr:adenylate kinase [Actinomycetota bacterium]